MPGEEVLSSGLGMTPCIMVSSLPVHSSPGQPEIDKDLHDVAHLVHEEFDDRLDPRAVDRCLDQIAARYSRRLGPFLRPIARRALRARRAEDALGAGLI